jgi:HSP20 family protein
MSKEKKSFFERLTGAVRVPEDDRYAEDAPRDLLGELEEEVESEAELTVDVYQTPTQVVIRTMAAGVRPDDLEVQVGRESVTIRGTRAEERTIREEDYFHRELYWGTFSRTIILPVEVETDEVEATERHGLITVKLNKIDKARQTKVRVKTS